jgi:DNA-binding SARP family transcriptional activator
MTNLSYDVEVLGNFRVTCGNETLVLSVSCARLVANLAVNGGSSRPNLANRLWPAARPPQNASNLRTTLWRLERSAPGLVRARGSALFLDAGETDVHVLLRWAHEAISNLGQPVSPPLGVGRELLPGWDDPWVAVVRAELHLLRVHALETVGAAFLMAGRVGQACQSALAAVALDPLRESATRLLIEVHLRGGNTVEALRCYDRFAGLLEREIGAAPSPAMSAIIAGYLGAEPKRSRATRGADEARLRRRSNDRVPRPRRSAGGPVTLR